MLLLCRYIERMHGAQIKRIPLSLTCRMACERDDVLFAAVGSCVLSLFPSINICITCEDKQIHLEIYHFLF